MAAFGDDHDDGVGVGEAVGGCEQAGEGVRLWMLIDGARGSGGRDVEAVLGGGWPGVDPGAGGAESACSVGPAVEVGEFLSHDARAGHCGARVSAPPAWGVLGCRDVAGGAAGGDPGGRSGVGEHRRPRVRLLAG